MISLNKFKYSIKDNPHLRLFVRRISVGFEFSTHLNVTDIAIFHDIQHRYKSEGKWLSKVHNVHWQLNWTCVLHGIIVQTQTLLKSINK